MTSEPERTVQPELLARIDISLSDPRTLRKTTRYMKRLVHILEEAGLPSDPATVSDLIYDAIAKTVDGTLSWDPSKVALATHLFGATRSRVSKEVHRGAVHSVPLHDLGDDTPEPLMSLVSPELQVGAAEELDRVRDALFRLCDERKDDQVRSLVTAYLDGFTGRAEISLQTGMAADQVTNARKRLDRMIAELPSELRSEPQGGGGERQ